MREPVRAIDVNDWTYEPVGPYVVQWYSERGAVEQLIVEEYPTRREAVVRFFDIGLPQRVGWLGSIVDARERRVLFWSSKTLTLDVCPEGVWCGVGAMFAAMDDAGVATPVDRAVWESMAKESIGV